MDPRLGVPRWATLIGSVLVGGMMLIGFFVTRFEFNALQHDMQEMRGDIKTILWRVGGPQAKDGAGVEGLQCVSEKALPHDAVILDRLWVLTKNLAGVPKVTKDRPLFCFAPYAIVFQEPDGSIRRLLGMYNARDNKAVVAILQSEPDTLKTCVVVHEMLHALVGPDEQKVSELWPACEVE